MALALVATTNYLLLVDLQTRQVTVVECESPEYYGISWFPQGRDLVLSHSGLNNSDLIDIASYAQSEKGWISQGAQVSRPFLSAPHQILCAPDGRVICTNTGRNSISIIDFARPTYFQEASVSSSRWDRLSVEDAPGDHLNSLYLQNDRLYVLAHRFRKGSALAVFSYPELELMEVEDLSPRTGMHNIWITAEGQRIACDSEQGSIVDLDARHSLWESGFPIYTRGLAATEDFIVVGESQKLGRDLRVSSLSGLWIIDPESWRSLDYLPLGPYGAVQELRILDLPDLAHHAQPFRGLPLLMENAWQGRHREARISAAHAWRESRHLWRDFDSVFGIPKLLDGGFQWAPGDTLCLALKRQDGESYQELRFDYVLSAGEEGHVSTVLGYRGDGGDTHMHALLLQALGDAAVLTVWQQDGSSWQRLPGPVAADCPLSGRVVCQVLDGAVSLSIDGHHKLTMSTTDLPQLDRNARLGIRWIGARLRPSSTAGG